MKHLKTLVDHYREYCYDMRFFEILNIVQSGESMRHASEILEVPYSRTKLYSERISEYHRLFNLQNNPDSIVNLDISYKDFKLLECMRIKTISRLRSLIADPLSRVDFSKKLIGNCRIALDEYDEIQSRRDEDDM